jgi:hypothetical protein
MLFVGLCVPRPIARNLERSSWNRIRRSTMSILAVLERRLGGTGNFTWSSLEMSMQPVTTAPTAFHADLSEAIRRALETFARVSLGLIFFIAGLDGFIDVLPHPSRPLPERAILFAGALLKSGYFFPMLKGTELVAGAVFLSKRLVPLAVAVRASARIVTSFVIGAFVQLGVNRMPSGKTFASRSPVGLVESEQCPCCLPGSVFERRWAGQRRSAQEQAELQVTPQEPQIL